MLDHLHPIRIDQLQRIIRIHRELLPILINELLSPILKLDLLVSVFEMEFNLCIRKPVYVQIIIRQRNLRRLVFRIEVNDRAIRKRLLDVGVYKMH